MKLTSLRPVDGGCRRYELTIYDAELAATALDAWDRLLLHDIQHGPRSETPIADHLLGLETIARRIEQGIASQRKLGGPAGKGMEIETE